MVQKLFNVGQETVLVPNIDICTSTVTIKAHVDV